MITVPLEITVPTTLPYNGASMVEFSIKVPNMLQLWPISGSITKILQLLVGLGDPRVIRLIETRAQLFDGLV